jgi:hypothetical protein
VTAGNGVVSTRCAEGALAPDDAVRRAVVNCGRNAPALIGMTLLVDVGWLVGLALALVLPGVLQAAALVAVTSATWVQVTTMCAGRLADTGETPRLAERTGAALRSALPLAALTVLLSLGVVVASAARGSPGALLLYVSVLAEAVAVAVAAVLLSIQLALVPLGVGGARRTLRAAMAVAVRHPIGVSAGVAVVLLAAMATSVLGPLVLLVVAGPLAMAIETAVVHVTRTDAPSGDHAAA